MEASQQAGKDHKNPSIYRGEIRAPEGQELSMTPFPMPGVVLTVLYALSPSILVNKVIQ